MSNHIPPYPTISKPGYPKEGALLKALPCDEKKNQRCGPKLVKTTHLLVKFWQFSSRDGLCQYVTSHFRVRVRTSISVFFV